MSPRGWVQRALKRGAEVRAGATRQKRVRAQKTLEEQKKLAKQLAGEAIEQLRWLVEVAAKDGKDEVAVYDQGEGEVGKIAMAQVKRHCQRIGLKTRVGGACLGGDWINPGRWTPQLYVLLRKK